MKLSEAIKEGLKCKKVKHGINATIWEEDETYEACALGLALFGTFGYYTTINMYHEARSNGNIAFSLASALNLDGGLVYEIVDWNDNEKLPITDIIEKLEARGL